MVHTCSYACMDTQDVSASRSKACPQLYKAGIDNLYFKWRVIVVWLIAATFQSLIFFFLPITCAQFPQNNPGRMLGVWDVSTMAYTCILITVNLRLMMASSSLTKWHHISVGGSIAAWFVFIFIYSGVQISFIQVLFLSETRIFTQNGEDWVRSRLWTCWHMPDICMLWSFSLVYLF
jgi:phospholipid-transporting ATPase